MTNQTIAPHMFQDQYLGDEVRGAIHNFALAARERLACEARDLLVGVYGLHPDGALEPPNNLPALADPETRATYDRLKQFLTDEVIAGLDKREAVDKLVKEIAFTHLNRLVAFKMMEARHLVREAVGRGADSNGFKFYLAEHAADYALAQAGQTDTAYRHFLLWQAGQISQQLNVLFDPDDLPSRLFPRPVALRGVLELLNAAGLAPAWPADETIGWVYQFFSEEEKREVFERLFRQKKKIRREDIPAATQLFTPRWIVRFIVENTLGRLWVQMHPDSHLGAALRYLVPAGGEMPREPLRAVKEITLLDPACGTMHFGLVAFDLFAEMYREELAHAGDIGWPAAPSVLSEAEIPAAIIKHNLFGIDIDLRAVQLSALTLYLKAKSLNKAAEISDHNLACADVLTLNGTRLNAFIREMKFSRPIYERLLRALWARLEDSAQLGSLLRLESEIGALIADEEKRFEQEGRQLDLFGRAAALFEREAAQAGYWDLLAAQLVQALDAFARSHAVQGSDERYFVREAAKGLRVLNLMLRRYDCVVANPPYMSRRNMNETLADFVADAYPEAKGDLYAAFIQRCGEFAGERGRVGMITQQSFMFISSYEGLRKGLLQEFAIESMAHVGPRAFAEISGEKVNTTIFAMRREPDTSRRQASIGTYFRLVHEPDSDAKRTVFEQAVAALQAGATHRLIYRVAQSAFDAIPGSPWVYWVSDSIRALFKELPGLATVAPPRQGLATADNFRFLRFWWEVGRKMIAFGCKTTSEASNRGMRWFPYMKGGAFKRWFGNQDYVINYRRDGRELKAWAAPLYGNSGWSRIIKSVDFYFREGVTYSYLTSGTSTSRISPGGFIFDVAGSTLFPRDLALVLGVMNSSFAAYALKLINPTVNFQVGDIARVPIPAVSDRRLSGLVGLATSLAKVTSTTSELTYDFVVPLSWQTGLERVQAMRLQSKDIEAQIDEDVYQLYKIANQERIAIEAELNGAANATADETLADMDEAGGNDDDIAESLTREDLAVRWISYAVGVVLGRFRPGVAGDLGSAIYRREDFAIGSLPMPAEGEFDELVGSKDQFAYVDAQDGRHLFAANVEKALQQLAVPDGITVLDEHHPRDLTTLAGKALDLMLGADAAQEVIRLGANGDLRHFLARDFFTRWHIPWYRKRPVYWPIQSNGRRYGFVLFHERITKDTFYALQREPYLDTKRRAVELALADAEVARAAAGKQRRDIERQMGALRELAAELAEFAKALEAITSGGYEPAPNWIDDGVIVRLAPLQTVIPLWGSEPKKCWEKLKNGELDWSHIAMHYWPDRVRKACRTNKSFAIAHGLEDVYQGD